MIVFVKGKRKTIKIQVSAYESLEGFTAKLTIGPATKQTTLNAKGEGEIEFNANEITKETSPHQESWGLLVISEVNGEMRNKSKIGYRVIFTDGNLGEVHDTINLVMPRKPPIAKSAEINWGAVLEDPSPTVKSMFKWIGSLHSTLTKKSPTS